LRKFRFKTDEAKYEEAKNDEQHYRERLNTEKKKEIYELTQEEKTELKKKFRKATFLCHPDKVSNEFREAAQRIFIELKDAYDANDLKKVTEILNELENGVTFKFKSETVSEKDMLKIAISKLSRQIKVVENLISSIKKSETYKTVQSIVDWDMYFNKTKEMLQRELAELKQDEKE
jgi:chemotaxis protein histidine kinase CheA